MRDPEVMHKVTRNHRSLWCNKGSKIRKLFRRFFRLVQRGTVYVTGQNTTILIAIEKLYKYEMRYT